MKDIVKLSQKLSQKPHLFICVEDGETVFRGPEEVISQMSEMFKSEVMQEDYSRLTASRSDHVTQSMGPCVIIKVYSSFAHSSAL